MKATGKLPWRTVLRHFQSPLAMQLAESKGAAVPIPLDSHHYNPVRGAAESTTPERLLELLHAHVQQAYGPSLRAAFLQLDTVRLLLLLLRARARARQLISWLVWCSGHIREVWV